MKNALSRFVESIYNIADKFHSKRLRKFYTARGIQTAIDVGSHKGEFIRFVVADKSIPIYSFEPQASVRQKLLENTSGFNVVEYFDCALSDQNAVVELHLNNLTSTTSLKKASKDNAWIKFKALILGGQLYAGTQSINARRMDDVLLESLISREKILLKIDVEGAESEVLQGAKEIFEKCDVSCVQIESSNYDIYEDSSKLKPHDILIEHGFRLEREFLFPLLNFTDKVYSRHAWRRPS